RPLLIVARCGVILLELVEAHAVRPPTGTAGVVVVSVASPRSELRFVSKQHFRIVRRSYRGSIVVKRRSCIDKGMPMGQCPIYYRFIGSNGILPAGNLIGTKADQFVCTSQFQVRRSGIK